MGVDIRTLPYCLYLASESDSGPTKVGVTLYSRVHIRLMELQTGNPRRLEVFKTFRFRNKFDAIKIESKVLEWWKPKAMNGEWLDLSPETVAAAVESAQQFLGISLDVAIEEAACQTVS